MNEAATPSAGYPRKLKLKLGGSRAHLVLTTGGRASASAFWVAIKLMPEIADRAL
jgi:hypothetical protein